MPDPFALVLVFASFAVTFLVARVLGKNWRKRRADKKLEESRRNESRQVRRARERSQSPR